ncbi:MAG: KpsF/GutQ family sugar-phosphate isomerase [Candidatus Marinimicrobia bacterium]|jgi:arabinose-5-phosphate isomerase|nr:KpsF/GutQ family sugar-phosphate isomerase [Candidatus Neomarinimicrobiota bacterium]MDP6339804.1 KpsF/GutQ family sugar-phosphate isomerase [Candidatus Neomarinimicrobiota bacterium]MDP6611592.1 KpsF/GutQ family sugar-phosphate isomerase [Candidatus Neomarinimicrobiota bacterium]|tara:strand:+ start:13674 stop:14654 length:981 start_codon:yes stop_codon:yes gene_type:complete
MTNSELKNIASQILRVEGQELINAADRVHDSIVRACEIIVNHSGKVVICGMGKSGLIAQKIVATLCSTGTKAVFLHAAEAVHGDLGIYAPGDPTILISKSGATEELIRLLPTLKEFESPLIGIMGNMKSPLVDQMDIVLDASVEKEADPLGIVPTSSTTLTMAIGDSLAAVLMSYRGFKHEDFAKLHPAGDLGRRLRLTVANIMQPLESVAAVSVDDRLRKVVIEMTEKPQGAALVVDGDNQLLGIVTEGDLRRCLANNGDIDQLTVGEVMTSNPVAVTEDALLKDAVTMMEDRKSQISVLPVVNGEGKSCAGLLRLHDVYQTQLF